VVISALTVTASILNYDPTNSNVGSEMTIIVIKAAKG
jgi:hypothetical protein